MPSRISQLLDRLSAPLPQKKPSPVRSRYEFRMQPQAASGITALQRALWELTPLVKGDEQAMLLVDALQLSYQLADGNADIIIQLRKIAEKLPAPADRPTPSPTLPQLPAEIKFDIAADAQELERCFAAGAYRSCVVLCGRILETALHRKYFEVTGQDILEKSPGIGLGNLIAKMKEKGINLDPALANQIHLINQVRVFSVHKKQEAFAPSKAQAQAIMLYTMDVVGRLFGK